MLSSKGQQMDIRNEIQKIAEYQNSQLPKPSKLSESAIAGVVSDALAALDEKSYDFSSFTHITLTQNGKTRKIKAFSPFSPEEILCVFIKRVLDRKYHIEYPNRNEFIHSLFDITNSLKDAIDYTIFRFDFKDFFNSVSASYVFEKCVTLKNIERWQIDLMKVFCDKTKYTYAGLNTSNILCEIIAKEFDEVLIQRFNNCGLIYYKRYIDDGILIFNQYLDQSKCIEIVNEAIQIVFYDKSIDSRKKCKTKLNSEKLNYITKRSLASTGKPESFDFLGYLFELRLSNKTTAFRYGLTQNKIDKYEKRINSIIREFAAVTHPNQELLRHQIRGFSSRTVYQVTRYKTVIWKSKGLISNYNELGLRMDQLTPETERFLKDCVFKAFSNNQVPLPYFMKGNYQQSVYCPYHNLKSNKTLLFVPMIGINMDTLKKMCRQVGIDVDNGKSYDGLVRDYLIKVKVGH